MPGRPELKTKVSKVSPFVREKDDDQGLNDQQELPYQGSSSRSSQTPKPSSVVREGCLHLLGAGSLSYVSAHEQGDSEGCTYEHPDGWFQAGNINIKIDLDRHVFCPDRQQAERAYRKAYDVVRNTGRSRIKTGKSRNCIQLRRT